MSTPKEQSLAPAALPNKRLGMVIYTDGGARPSRGVAGYGIHGYVYDLDEITDKPARSRDAFSVIGYVSPDPDTKKYPTNEFVKPLSYVDVIAPFAEQELTNNYAEISAVLKALSYAKDVEKLVIHSDSDTTVKGINLWMEKWAANGWTNSQGKTVLNLELWKSVRELWSTLTNVTIQHIEAHAGYLGNEIADELAGKAIIATRKQTVGFSEVFSSPQGYWNKKEEMHRFLQNSKLYFSLNVDQEHKLEDGRKVYYLGDHGKHDNLSGKRASDHTLSVVALKEPDSVIDQLVDYQQEVTDHEVVAVGWLILTKLSKSVYNEILEEGTKYLYRHPHKNKVIDYLDEPYSTEANPPRLVYRVIDQLNIVESILVKAVDHFDGKDMGKGYGIQKVTDQFYQVGSTDKQTKLLPSIVQQTVTVPVEVKRENKDQTLRLSFGIELPSRNTFTAIANAGVDVYIVTAEIVGVGFQYYTVIKTKDDIGIWTCPHANIKIEM